MSKIVDLNGVELQPGMRVVCHGYVTEVQDNLAVVIPDGDSDSPWGVVTVSTYDRKLHAWVSPCEVIND